MGSEAISPPADKSPILKEPVATEPDVAAATSGVRAEPCHVLLVEDHADTAVLMRRLLTRRGYQVTLVNTVADALAAINLNTFDLLLSDLGLPDGSGLDLMRTLTTRSNTLPAIALSGYGMPRDAGLSREAGFLEHLTKPISVERLWAAIDRVLSNCPTAADG